MARKTCFLVMPFREKPTGLKTGKGPEKVDFDRLFHLALEPALDALGYDVDRADQDTGSLIIKEMIERLAYADLVAPICRSPTAMFITRLEFGMRVGIAAVS
jgi:hypothetical protein